MLFALEREFNEKILAPRHHPNDYGFLQEILRR